MVSNIVIFSSLMTNIFQSFDSTHVASRHQTLTFAPEFLVTRVCVTQCTNGFCNKNKDRKALFAIVFVKICFTRLLKIGQ